MAENKLPDIRKLKNKVLKLIDNDLPKLAGNRAVRHFKASFENGGFTDTTLQPWRKTKSGKRSRFGQKSGGILIGSGALKRSIRILKAKGGSVIVTAGNQNIKYAQIHNEGGTVNIPITAKSRKYFWHMYKITNDLKWKRMALTKKESFTFKMPKRQFMGNSKMLNNEIAHLIAKKIDQLKID